MHNCLYSPQHSILSFGLNQYLFFVFCRLWSLQDRELSLSFLLLCQLFSAVFPKLWITQPISGLLVGHETDKLITLWKMKQSHWCMFTDEYMNVPQSALKGRPKQHNPNLKNAAPQKHPRRQSVVKEHILSPTESKTETCMCDYSHVGKCASAPIEELGSEASPKRLFFLTHTYQEIWTHLMNAGVFPLGEK